MGDVISSLVDFFTGGFESVPGLSEFSNKILSNLSGLLGNLFTFLNGFLDTLFELFNSGNTLLGILLLLLFFKIIKVIK